MFKKIIVVWLALFSVLLYGEQNKDPRQTFIKISKQMVEGKIFYSQYEGNSFYIQTNFKKIDPIESFGEVLYKMMNSAKSISGSVDYVSYRLKNGKIVIYGNDGSASRLTLISVSDDRWILLEEEDMDGMGKRFGFKKTGKETWYLKKPQGYPPLEKCKPFEGECFVEAFKFPV